jgi:hypothetical protein
VGLAALVGWVAVSVREVKEEVTHNSYSGINIHRVIDRFTAHVVDVRPTTYCDEKLCVLPFDAQDADA